MFVSLSTKMWMDGWELYTATTMYVRTYVCVYTCPAKGWGVHIFPCHTSVVRFKRIPMHDIRTCICVSLHSCPGQEMWSVWAYYSLRKWQKGRLIAVCSTVSHIAARAVRLTNTERRADSSKGLEEGSLTMRNEGHSRIVVVLVVVSLDWLLHFQLFVCVPS